MSKIRSLTNNIYELFEDSKKLISKKYPNYMSAHDRLFSRIRGSLANITGRRMEITSILTGNNN
jgi:hypothetical protein